jgi:hypothetical protein
MKIIILITVLESLVITWITIHWHSRTRRSTARVGLPQRTVLSPSNDLKVGPVSTSLDAAHWAFINELHLEGQRDVQRPVIGPSRFPAEQRRSPGIRRRSHQVNYKEWSKERHE